MYFKDEATIEVVAGRGGDGALSFRREKYVPRGGPDGGDGGNGGHVVFVADSSINTLYELHRRRKITAETGHAGSGANKSGRRGKDTFIRIPVGTIVRVGDRILHDFRHDGEQIVVARGGKGGHGNKHYANAERQTPRFAEGGRLGTQRKLDLELRLIADVGLVGLPNAGKSTLLSRCSRAEPKIADYPFTTLVPQLGIAALDIDRTFVMADLPGLIEGASVGRGLGDRFLRHISRTRLLLHMVDASSGDAEMVAQAARVIADELADFSQDLAAKPAILVGNKIDIPGASEAFQEAAALLAATDERFAALPRHSISAATGEGIGTLLETVWEQLARIERPTLDEVEASEPAHEPPATEPEPTDADPESPHRESIEVRGMLTSPPHKRNLDTNADPNPPQSAR